MMLPRESPSAVTFNVLTGPTNDMQRDVTPPHMPHQLLQLIALMKSAVTTRLSMAQRQSERDFGRNVRQEQIFKVRDYVFVDRPGLVVMASDAADEMANHPYNKLLRGTSGLYRVLSV